MYYFLIEFLFGKFFVNNLINLGICDVCREVLNEFGIIFEDIEEVERELGFGNGGLGRFVVCFLDLMVLMGFFGYGNGIRY